VIGNGPKVSIIYEIPIIQIFFSYNKGINDLPNEGSLTMCKLTCSPTVEVLGANLNAFFDNLQSDETTPIVRKYGVENPILDKWYPEQSVLGAINELSALPNFTFNFVAIGMEIGRICPMPPDLKDPSLGEVLMAWNGIYQYLHRNGDVGAIRCEKVNDKHYKTIHTDMYPDDFSYGIVYGYAKRFLPPGTRFKVFYDPEITPRDRGGTDTTVIHVSRE
jgi:hypothetical protein